MKNLRYIFFILLVIWAAGYNTSYAQSESTGCDLSGFVTYSQGAWGSPSKSTPGKLRDKYFSTVFTEGISLGSVFKLNLSSANSVAQFLPQGGKPSGLDQDYNNSSKTSAGVLGGQLTAAMLNYHFNNSGLLGSNQNYTLGELVINEGPFEGVNVEQFLSIANAVIGGESDSYSFSEINEALTAINENFENGNDKGYLRCPVFLRALIDSKVGDKVWFDANRNGIQESYEAGMSDVTLKIYDCNKSMLQETKTDSEGKYLFTGLTAGTYYLEFVLPEHHYFSSAAQGEDNDLDSDADPSTGITTCFSLNEGEVNLSFDAGIYNRFSTIGDRVWLDLNCNGQPALGEPGVEGVTVKLFDCSGVFKAQTITNSDGRYYFSVNSGYYYLQFILPAGYAFTRKDYGTSDNTDSDCDAEGFTDCFEITPDGLNYSFDAGLVPAASPGTGTREALLVNKNNVWQNSSEVPVEFKLNNYPNPFNPVTVIQFSIPAEGHYSLKIYNLLGEEAATLADDIFQPGTYSVPFNGKDFLSGIYFYNLAGENINLTGKMSLVK